MISQEKLKEFLHYDSDTGVFTWLASQGNRKAGYIAGCPVLGYIQIRIEGKLYYAHRLAWLYVYGVWPKEIDHINHARNDNQIINLREVTHQENGQNQSLSKNNKSGVQGISWHKRIKKWAAYISASGKRKHLGYFTVKADAIAARKAAELLYGFHANHGNDIIKRNKKLGDRL